MSATDLQRSRQALDLQFKGQIERLIRWCEINSGSSNMAGLTSMCSEIKTLFSPLADRSEQIQAQAVSEVNDSGEEVDVQIGDMLLFQKRPELKRRILLVGHMDTVFDSQSAFQTCKWLDDNTLNGPGVADMKGGLLVIYEALRQFEQLDISKSVGWDVFISGDEETSSRGSASFIHNIAQTADIGLVYEPALADGTLSGQRKGTGNFALVVRGQSAHAGREFHLGRNALAMAATAMSKLHDLNSQRDSITLNLGRVSGGDALNKVPDLAVVRFNARIETADDQQWLQDQFAKIVAEINAIEGHTAELKGSFTRPPKLIDNNQKRLNDLLITTGNELNIQVAFKATGGCCDGNNLKAAGLSNIDTMGVRGGNIHSEDEYVLVDSLAERAHLSLRLLENWAAGESFKTSAQVAN